MSDDTGIKARAQEIYRDEGLIAAVRYYRAALWRDGAGEDPGLKHSLDLIRDTWGPAAGERGRSVRRPTNLRAGNVPNIPRLIAKGDDGMLGSARYTWTWVRYGTPKKGEYYLSGATPEAWRARNDLTTEFHIVKLGERYVRRQRWVSASEADKGDE